MLRVVQVKRVLVEITNIIFKKNILFQDHEVSFVYQYDKNNTCSFFLFAQYSPQVNRFFEISV